MLALNSMVSTLMFLRQLSFRPSDCSLRLASHLNPSLVAWLTQFYSPSGGRISHCLASSLARLPSSVTLSSTSMSGRSDSMVLRTFRVV